jgi:aminotransferase in exopolysaccharide biosynthesis
MTGSSDALAASLVAFVRAQFGTGEFIPLHAPHFDARDVDYVRDAVESGFVSTVGRHVGQFEQAVMAYTGARHAVATVNGTSALHAALLVAGVQTGDEVITQSITFVATCNAIRYCGAEPVLVDIERATLGMAPESLQAFLEEHAERRDDGLCWNRMSGRVIRACVPMHNGGHPVRIDRIAAICQEWGLVLVEDAAESLGSLYRGLHTGRTGGLSVLSFNGNKIITTGGGGMILTDDETLAARARHLTTTAKQPHPYLYQHDEVGFNYRLPALNAALGCAQMEKLPDYVERKRALALRYAHWFQERGVPFVHEPEGARSNYWFNAFLAEDRAQRDAVLAYTNAQGVMTRPLWTPMHTLPMYAHCQRSDLPVSEWAEARLVNVPSSVI